MITTMNSKFILHTGWKVSLSDPFLEELSKVSLKIHEVVEGRKDRITFATHFYRQKSQEAMKLAYEKNLTKDRYLVVKSILYAEKSPIGKICIIKGTINLICTDVNHKKFVSSHKMNELCPLDGDGRQFKLDCIPYLTTQSEKPYW